MFTRRMESLATGLLKPMNPNGAALLGLLTFFWGIWVVNPFWHVFVSADVYMRALEFAPEWAWGTWATATGIAIMCAVWHRDAVMLSRAACFSVWHWFTVSVMMWWGDWQNTAGLVYMFIGFYAVFVFLNIRVNYVRQGIHRF